MIKVIQVVSAISEEASGPSYTVPRLSNALRQIGVASRIGALDWDESGEVHGDINTFPYMNLRYIKKLGISRPLKNWLASETFLGVVDVIHSHGLWMMPNIYPVNIALKKNIPHVISPRGTLSPWALKNSVVAKSLFWRLHQKRALNLCSCLHATSFSEYEDIRRVGIKQPVAVIPNGIDMQHELPNSKTNSFRTVLFLGRIHPKKGLENLLYAWKSLQDRYPQWQLRIVGPDNGGYIDEVKKIAKDLRLVRCKLEGPLYGSQKWAAYAGAEIFVLPTYSENFGMTVAEALSTGTPVVVTNGAPWESINAVGAGVSVDVGVEPLILGLSNLMSLPEELLVEMGEKGKLWMKKNYTWDSVGIKMQEMYKWVTKRAEAPDFILFN